MSKPVMEDMFAWSGRRNRKSYVLFSLLFLVASLLVGFVAGIIAAVVSGGDEEATTGLSLILSVVLTIPLLVAYLAASAQRCRDFGWTGWGAAITMIPLIGSGFWIALMIIPGNGGENKYGPDPLGGTAPVVVEPMA